MVPELRDIRQIASKILIRTAYVANLKRGSNEIKRFRPAAMDSVAFMEFAWCVACGRELVISYGSHKLSHVPKSTRSAIKADLLSVAAGRNVNICICYRVTVIHGDVQCVREGT